MARERRHPIGFLLTVLAGIVGFTVFVAFPLDRRVRPRATNLAAPPHLNASLNRSYKDRPLAFEANLGQADTSVKFLSRGDGYVLLLAPSEAVLQLVRVDEP